ncbi:hypothetical protein H0H92_016025 [Tricholoma furcatifolium]|nr:hypothetical protein H0H92_016025 [Tricholoma furcatifolium]
MGAAGAFSLDQLMELSGLACAQALAKVYNWDKYPRVLVCCGPGNQGGDGLAAARTFRNVWVPAHYLHAEAREQGPLSGGPQRLQMQCNNMKIPTLPPSSNTESLRTALSSSDVILDAIFGFSFKGPIRAPFDVALPLIAHSGLPIVSVDIPSGWDVIFLNCVPVSTNALG